MTTHQKSNRSTDPMDKNLKVLPHITQYYGKVHSRNFLAFSKKELAAAAKAEISRLLSHLNPERTQGEAEAEAVYQKFLTVRKGLTRGTKYRSPEKLVPLCMYFVWIERHLPINESELLEAARISKKEFDAFKLLIHSFLPRYKERNRQALILTGISELTEEYGLDRSFYFQSKKILFHAWESLKHNKDGVITILVVLLALLYAYRDAKKEGANVRLLCKRLNITIRTLQEILHLAIHHQYIL